MIVDVELLNCNVFEKDGKKKCRIGYRLLNRESVSNSAKFKGFAELSVFLEDETIFEKLTLDLFGYALKFEFIEEANPRDPMKKRVTLKKIMNAKNEDICVLQ